MFYFSQNNSKYFYFIRAKEKDYDKDEEEDAYERKKQERKIREKEAVYQEVSMVLYLLYVSKFLKCFSPHDYNYDLY